MNAALRLIFFASGAAALLFETLWFREAGLMLGNSVWATSLVTSSLMAGLAVGNALAARRGAQLERPALCYAMLEAAIAVSGLGLVVLLSRLTALLAPLFRPLSEHLELLNSARFLIAFSLLLIPAAAMGATLPVLARALSARDPLFGRVLGGLYGWNTLGAVVGALAGEGFLIERLGMRGTGFVAAGINAAAAGSAWLLARGPASSGLAPESGSATTPLGRASQRLLAAAFLAGMLLLSLELVWFRLLLLRVWGTSLAFAFMLAAVLLGIGLGGLLAGAMLRARSDPWLTLPALALAAGATTAWTYAALPEVLASFGGKFILLPGQALCVALSLMVPTSLLSGMLFTFMGAALKAEGRDASGAAGALTLANTLGGMVGPLLTGFVLLPTLGIERSLFGLAAGYGLVAILSARPDRLRQAATRWTTALLAGSVLGYLAVLALFPFGLMRNYFVRSAAAPFLGPGTRIEGHREGLNETITYVVRELWGQAVDHRLLTNGFSMSGSTFGAIRYMRLFVEWPMAVHPDPKRALLISYGVGITAKALTDSAALQSIDVVDISRDILEMGRLVFPAPGTFPLDDARVRVHVEDGRFFLLTTRGSYDIITAEPPPLKNAGVVNLYSREYFELIHDRLARGGIVTYWLPVYQLEGRETRALLHGFCDVFEDCSLWAGMGLEWMLVGTRGAEGPVSETQFARQWTDPVAGRALRRSGFESPELMATTFLADSALLRKLAADTPPLDDDHPLRISSRFADRSDPLYHELLEARAARERFAASPLVARLFPEALRERALALFDAQGTINRFHTINYGAPPPTIEELDAVLTKLPLRSAVLAALATDELWIEAARRAAALGSVDPFVDELLAIDALADREWNRAADLLQRAERGEHAAQLRPLHALALGLAGRRQEARTLLASARRSAPPDQRVALDWLDQRFP